MKVSRYLAEGVQIIDQHQGEVDADDGEVVVLFLVGLCCAGRAGRCSSFRHGVFLPPLEYLPRELHVPQHHQHLRVELARVRVSVVDVRACISPTSI